MKRMTVRKEVKKGFRVWSYFWSGKEIQGHTTVGFRTPETKCSHAEGSGRIRLS